MIGDVLEATKKRMLAHGVLPVPKLLEAFSFGRESETERESEGKCASCKWSSLAVTGAGLPHASFVECRHRSPNPGWPVKMWNDWCGDHDPRTKDPIR